MGKSSKDKERDKQRQSNMDQYTTRDQSASEPLASPPTAQQATLLDNTAISSILNEIKDSHNKLGAKIDHLVTKLELMQHHVTELGTRTTVMESRVDEVDDRVTQLQSTVGALTKQVSSLTEKCDDLEGRSRRNNIRIVGVPEGSEHGRVEVYIERLLQGSLGDPCFSPMFTIERAHRTLAPRPSPGSAPRPILARFLNFRDRDTALRRARELGELRHEGAKIMLFPDFSPNVQKARKSYDNVRRILREKNYTYSMLFPSRLKVMHDGKSTFFQSPAEALDFAEKAPIRSRKSPNGGLSPQRQPPGTTD